MNPAPAQHRTLEDVADAPPADIVATLVGATHLVITSAMHIIHDHVENCLKDGGRNIIIDGRPGLGKTTILHASCALVQHRVVFLALTGRLNDKAFWREIAIALMLDTGGTAPDIADRCYAELRREPTVLVIDDAHLVSADGLVRLRGLRKQSGYNIGVVLCGNNLVKKLDNIGTIRRNRTVPLKPLTAAQMENDLHQLHDLMKALPLPVLQWVDAEYAHGRWFEWTNFCGELVDQHDPTAPFDPVETTLDVLHSLNGARPKSRPKMQ